MGPCPHRSWAPKSRCGEGRRRFSSAARRHFAPGESSGGKGAYPGTGFGPRAGLAAGAGPDEVGRRADQAGGEVVACLGPHGWLRAGALRAGLGYNCPAGQRWESPGP